MIAFAGCKINIGLNVVRKRPDGFHDLETVFFPVPWHDAVEVIKSDEFKFTVEGAPVEGAAEDNLCVKAYRLLKQDFQVPPVHLCLLKNIPTGAGLGGGSSDGAVTLKLLNSFFDLQLTDEKLQEYALLLGSDCPFFIKNRAIFASGRGELFEDIRLDLSKYHLLIVHPGVHVSTAEAFSKITPSEPEKSLKALVLLPMEEWKSTIKNDFEPGVFQQHPELKAMKDQLYSRGAAYAAMSGSGSAIFGIFDKEPEDQWLNELKAQKNYRIFSGKMGNG